VSFPLAQYIKQCAELQIAGHFEPLLLTPPSLPRRRSKPSVLVILSLSIVILSHFVILSEAKKPNRDASLALSMTSWTLSMTNGNEMQSWSSA